MDSIKAITNNGIIKMDKTNGGNPKIDFKDFLIQSIEKVNQDQLHAEAMDKALITGEIDNIHDVMIASQKAELSLNFAVEIRNKLMESYKEIMRIQL